MLSDSSHVFIKYSKKEIAVKVIKQSTSLTNFLNEILEESLDFSFMDYFKQLLCSKSKKTTLYSVAIKNLENIMEIKTYLRNNLELKLIKNVIFDQNQHLTFNTFSLFTYLQTLFDSHKNEIKMIGYDKNNFKEFFDSLNALFLRNNSTDKKIINFISKFVDGGMV